MRRNLTLVTIFVFAIFIIFLTTLYLWIKQDVQYNIYFAEEKYNEIGENALLSFLKDAKNRPHDRTHLAIWTLGKIRSKKALPILKGYYLNDPKGLSCKGMHQKKLCQYEIHKAIKAIEDGAFLSYASLK